ncbi:MAG: MFS transporter [Lachnospiraceae bacterium]|nr:MFS transporter [Lachnospiraceae bacterium]
MNGSFKHTLKACYLGYITQAIINNLAPLLFVTFQKQFQVSVEQLGLLISMNFFIQMVVDVLAARYVEQLGYRACLVVAHFLCVVGLAGLNFFPIWLPWPVVGLALAMGINAVGGGLIEVLVSPLVEALPGEQKASAMSMLHSFYCWGHMAVVLASTLYFNLFGLENWNYLPLLWALVPLANAFLFGRVPIRTLSEDGAGLSLSRLLSLRLFWLFFVLMICSGAAEQAMSQWSSLFAETGLGVSKTLGDLLGTCTFALLMGASRLFYGKKGSQIPLQTYLFVSASLCVGAYLLAVFAPWPLLSLVGCGFCGFSVGIMWPGVFSMASLYIPMGGTAMFGLLALAGDVGCSAGPGLVGMISGLADGELKAGLLASVIFPLLLVLLVPGLGRNKKMDGTDIKMKS